MQCPKCKQDISHVRLISLCHQDADIDNNGKITNYDGDIEVDGYMIERAYCPMCGKNIIKHIKQ